MKHYVLQYTALSHLYSECKMEVTDKKLFVSIKSVAMQLGYAELKPCQEDVVNHLYWETTHFCCCLWGLKNCFVITVSHEFSSKALLLLPFSLSPSS